MNIFYLDRDPEIAAQMHCDKHVVKMILESAQMLSIAHRVLDGDDIANSKGLYKMTHKNHPCAIWARTNSENYGWLWSLYDNLMKEYTYRYYKHHASERMIHNLWALPQNMSHGDFTDPPQCMPDYCKSDDTVSAYQIYYILKKLNFATWKRRDMPEWINEKRGLLGLHGRKLREEREAALNHVKNDHAQLTESHYSALQRIKDLIKENSTLQKGLQSCDKGIVELNDEIPNELKGLKFVSRQLEFKF